MFDLPDSADVINERSSIAARSKLDMSSGDARTGTKGGVAKDAQLEKTKHLTIMLTIS